ncbi:MAG: hypothetical protein PHR26_00310 [Candidatus ainarchaeum sp.]|nr:hypothetical protein [Candidatus ainarchaeum sp.]MDD3975657.1 hypothetical protein [Candidatus ainarchaeum sp.]
MTNYLIKDCLNDHTKISKINNSCKELHITQAFSYKTAEKIYNKSKKINLITVSKSTKERISPKTKQFLKSKNINLVIKKEQGRPIDIPIEKLNQIIKMHKDYSYRDLAEKLKIPKSTIHYLIKKSKKKKLKNGNKIIYLK